MAEDTSTTTRHESSSTSNHWSGSTVRQNWSSTDTETTPLLASQEGNQEQDQDVEDQASQRPPSSAGSHIIDHLRRGTITKDSLIRRWPSILALVCLCIIVIFILVGIFIIPEAVREYAAEAFVFEPTSLSVNSYSDSGVIARVQGLVIIDSSRVKKKSARDLGRFATYIAQWAETDTTTLELSLPEYGEVVVAAATVPGIKVNIQDGYTTAVDFNTEIQPGVREGIRRVAEDFIAGKLSQLHVQAMANVNVRSGIISASQKLIKTIPLSGKDVPGIPDYSIRKVLINDTKLPDGRAGLQGQAFVRVENPYPVDFSVPALGFAISASNCAPSDPKIHLANVKSKAIHIKPKEAFTAELTALIQPLSDKMLKDCPDSQQSPLDSLVYSYTHGQATTVYVQGSNSTTAGAPKWLTQLIAGITVPVSLPGQEMGHLIKSFNLEGIKFQLPSLFAPPNSPESYPRITADIKALIALPEEINFSLDVHRVRTTANIFYKGKQLGYLDVTEWQNATSKKVDGGKADNTGLQIKSHIDKAPLVITDQEVFTDFMTAYLTSNSPVKMDVKADVDVEVTSPLKTLVLKKIPAENTITVNPPGDSLGSLTPRLGDVRITRSDKTFMQIEALVNFTNPSPYTASIPFADLHILVNGTWLGQTFVQNITIMPGKNVNIPVHAIWEPLRVGGEEGTLVGREFLSQYISGYNVTLTLKSHRGTIPAYPLLGEALKSLNIELPMPHIGGPGGGDRSPHFIENTTMHIFSSTATFSIRSPFKSTFAYIRHINATAFYKGDAVGGIIYDDPIPIPPGRSESPPLPVSWNLSSVGFDAIREALGGTLKLSAKANIVVQIGNYVDRVWYLGRSIGANIRL